MAPIHPQWGLYFLLALLLLDAGLRGLSWLMERTTRFLAEQQTKPGALPQPAPLPSAHPRNMNYEFRGP